MDILQEVGDFFGDILEAGGSVASGYGDNATNTTDLNKAAAERIRLNNEIARQNAIQAKERNKNIEKLFISAGYIILGMSVLFFGVKIWRSYSGGKNSK